MKSTPYRILALDVDGTLLDPNGALRPRTAEAVARALQAGIRAVLCTGRRYRRARPIARLLGLNAPLVCNSGAIIKDPSDHRTIWRADFDEELAAAVLGFFRRENQQPVVFTDRHPDQPDFVVSEFPTGQPYFDEYVAQNREYADINPAILAGDLPELDRETGNSGIRSTKSEQENPKKASRGSDALFHVCAIGERSDMLTFQRIARDRIGDRIQTFVQRSPLYLGTMCEILRQDASKWSAILRLARLWGIDPGEVCAVGDDVNDIPMLKNAGLGVAMGHASRDVLEAADLVTGDHDQDGVAMLVDDILLA
ncbi:MAG TPA: HAD-IIB family hydrolase [Isosphaeraceae bacterium]|nr:HAD-IIB family hydrolase [Isosphaeraceae bacterium]